MSTSNFSYPPVERDDTIDKIFDVDVPDPYRWLENSEDSRTKQFVSNQIAITEPYISKCPHRDRIKEILTTNQDYKKIGCPFKRGNKYYFFMNSGLQPQSVLYQQESIESEPRVFFDPNTLSDDGTVSLSISSFSPNGEYFAYGLSRSGSDWIEIHIKDVTSGQDLEDKLVRAKFTSIEWTKDNKGFFYAQFPDYNGTEGTETDRYENHSIYYHTVGTKQSEDKLKVDFRDHPNWNIACEVSQDGHYLFVYAREGCQDNLWYFCDLREFAEHEKFTLKPLYDKMEAEFNYITSDGETVYFLTNLEAKNYRLAKLNLSNPAKENWTDVIPNNPTDVLEWVEAYLVGDKRYILVNYMRKVAHHLELHELEGKIVKKFDTPPGTISKQSGRLEDSEFFFHFTSFLTPGQIFHFDLRDIAGSAKLIRKSEPNKFNSEDYTIKQVFYHSKDGTEVPMFIVHRKDLELDGSNPCILYGYGGFNIAITSAFNINRITWLKHFQGVLAVANIRGGGELGQNWHDSGRLLNKQNSYTDFAAAAEYLIDNKYTRRSRLAIEGGSNGGLLVAATSNQRPDLFGATICHVGVLDMTRFHKFTIGHAWTSDYGNPSEKEHFFNLLKYSPYHNIPDSASYYPATLVLTADHDDRVVPLHSFKFIAQLQHKLGSKLKDTPFLIRIETKAGHGGGKPISKVIDQYTDVYSFLYNALGLEDKYIDN